MSSNITAIQSFSFEQNASSDEENEDEHGSITLQDDALEWRGAWSLWPASCSFYINTTIFFKHHVSRLLLIQNLNKEIIRKAILSSLKKFKMSFMIIKMPQECVKNTKSLLGAADQNTDLLDGV